MRTFPWAALALLLAVFVAAVAYGCGGGSNDDKNSAEAELFPTATLPSSLPAPIIVSGTPQTSGGSGRYTVQSGDNPASIAARFGVSLDELLSVNDITDPTDLHVGDELIIPGGNATPQPQATSAPQEEPTEEPPAVPTSASNDEETYTVQAGDNPASIAAQFGITAQELMDANGITDPSSLQVGQVLTIPAPNE